MITSLNGEMSYKINSIKIKHIFNVKFIVENLLKKDFYFQEEGIFKEDKDYSIFRIKPHLLLLFN